jgi:hypothetical protein
MTTNFRKIAIVSAALLGFAMSQPVASSWAASPTSAGNQLVQVPSRESTGPYDPSGPARGAGIYDNYDQYRNAQGFPLPGYAPLFEPTN